jgi:hypothetical protein
LTWRQPFPLFVRNIIKVKLMRKIQIWSFFVLLALSIAAEAQDFEWVKQFGGANVTEGNKIVTDQWGNVYSMGTFSGTVDFDPGPGTFTLNSGWGLGWKCNFVCKLDSSGGFLWVKSFSDVRVNDLITDQYGNLFVLGAFNGTVDIDPGATTYIIGPHPNSAYILKLDPTGNFIWVKTLNSTANTADCYGQSIALDSAQNIYITGGLTGNGPYDFDPDTSTYYLSGNLSNFFISVLDSNGKFLFAKVRNSSTYNYIYYSVYPGKSIAILGNGVMVSGVEVDKNNVSTQRLFFTKYDASGNELWSKTIAGPYPSGLLFSYMSAFSNVVFVVGSYIGTIDFDPGPGIANRSSPAFHYSHYILALTDSGNFIQVQQIDDNAPNGYVKPSFQAITDAAGSIYISGCFEGLVDFAPNIGQIVNLSSANKSGFILKLDPFGEFEWVKQIGENSNCSVNGMALDAFGNIYTVGSFTGTVDFDPAGTYNLSALGSFDAFVHKLSGPLITGVKEMIPGNELSIYPNPTHGLVYLHAALGLDRAVCRVMDLNGRQILEKRNITGASFEMNLSEQPKGFYLLEVSDHKTISRMKLIKE